MTEQLQALREVDDEREPERIAVVGLGYVGLTTAVCLTAAGYQVTGLDNDAEKVSALLLGKPSFHEPNLATRLSDALTAKTLALSTNPIAGVDTARFVFLCLPTPQTAEGAADTASLWSVLRTVRPRLRPGTVVVIKSTVPVGTTRAVATYLSDAGVKVVANPEFLREGHAVEDFFSPHRIVVGADERNVGESVAALYRATDSPVHLTSSESAELAKYAANAFLALRLSYANMIAELCEHSGADTRDVLAIIGADPRIGTEYLRPGPGWGGPCLPKDTSELIHFAETTKAEHSLLQAAVKTNQHQHRRIIEALTDELGGTLRGRRIGLFGLAFKAGTSDVRNSPSVSVANELIAEGAMVTAYDPMVTTDPRVTGLVVTQDPYRAASSADALLSMTDWPQFNDLDWERISGVMTGAHVLDTRDSIDRTLLQNVGLSHSTQWRGTRTRHRSDGHPRAGHT